MTYSVENAQAFRWGSVTGALDPGRVRLLERHAVGPRVLDAGCGGGAYVEHLAGRGFEATGVDVDPQFLSLREGGGRKGSYHQADLTALPFPDKHFDSACCFDVLEHLDDGLALRELLRVTKRRLLVTVPRKDSELGTFGLTFFHYQDRTHLREYTEESLAGALREAGMTRFQIDPELDVPFGLLVWHFLKRGRRPSGLRNMFLAPWVRVGVRLVKFPSVPTGLVALIDLE